jgi:hypothetical protein
MNFNKRKRDFLKAAGTIVLVSGLGGPEVVANAAVVPASNFVQAKNVPGTADEPDIKIGDSWTYEERDGYNHNLKSGWTGDVISAEGIERGGIGVFFLDSSGGTYRRDWTHSYGRPWNLSKQVFPGGREISFEPALLSLPFPLEAGRSWRQDVAVTDSATGKSRTWKVYGKVRGWEKVKVPAGEFLALKVVKDIYLGDADWWRSETRRSEVDWYTPAVKWIVKHEEAEDYYAEGDLGLQYGDRTVWELVSYTVRDWP